MPKQRNKSRPISFRVPVERFGAVERAAARAGLSAGKWAESLVAAALAEEPVATTPEAFTGMDWRDAQLPPGDRADAHDDPLVPAHSGGFIAPQEPMYDIGGLPAPLEVRSGRVFLAEDTATQNAAFSEEVQHNSGHTATHEQETTSGRTDDRYPVDPHDGESSDDLPRESEGGGPLDGGVSGQDHPGVSDQGDDCPECGGTGLLNPEIDGTPCPACGHEADQAPGVAICRECGGTGFLNTDPSHFIGGTRCPTCSGDGITERGAGTGGPDARFATDSRMVPDEPASRPPVGGSGVERGDPALSLVQHQETAEWGAGAAESGLTAAELLASASEAEDDVRRRRFERLRTHLDQEI